jgi:membrane associated rhomboid family serine protease
MTPTPVGMRCPDCAGQKTKVRTARSMVVEPRVTYALIAINVAAFFAQVMTEGGGRVRDGDVYVEGSLVGVLVDQGDWWRIITSGFLHANPIHLVLNMVVLYFLGQMLEPAFGHLKFVAIYFASLLAGSFGAILLTDALTPTVGASGAVYGLIGAAVAFYRDRGIAITQSPIFGLLVINVLFTFFYPNVSIGGHLGGLAGGFLAAFLVLEADRRRSLPLALGGCAAVALVGAVGAIAAASTPTGF